MKKMIISCILIFILVIPGQKIHFNWTELSSPITTKITLLKVNSANDFIVSSQDGAIFHFKNGEWKDLRVKSDLKLNPFVFFENDSLIIAAGTDQKWYTHFFSLVNDTWYKYNFDYNLPIFKIFQTDQGIYATGAWGTLLKLEKDNWTVLDTPFSNHVHQVTTDVKDNIWLGVLSDSVYKYDHKKFTAYPFEDNIKTNIYGIKATDSNSVEVITNNHIIYNLSNGEFVKGQKYKAGLWSLPNYDKFGFVQISIDLNNTESINVEIPIDFKITNHIHKPDSTIYLASRTGKVYIGQPGKFPQFVDLAETYKVSGTANSHTSGAAFADINLDGLIDLYVNSAAPQDYSHFFLNNLNAPFTDGADAFKLFHNGLANSFFLTDVNNDQLVDLIVTDQDTSRSYLSIHKNIGNGHFEESDIVNLPEKYDWTQRKNLSAYDLDKDGDLDPVVTDYYGAHQAEQGGVYWFDNSFFGSFHSPDTTFFEISSGWNKQIIFADFNADDLNDIYIANEWRKNKLLIQTKNGWHDEAENRIINLTRDETLGAAAFDFDNDGDLDIITLSDTLFISFFENDGNGYFKNITERVGLKSISSPYTNIVSNKNICLADFNNDGFTDIFITLNDPDTDRNYLMINQYGQYFEDFAEEYGIIQPSVNGVIAGDIDNDGDIDLFGYSESNNILWVNTLDNKSFIKIKPEGTVSNKLGMSAKIWLYQIDSDQEILWGYKQIGSDIFGKNQLNDFTAHFGVEKEKIYKAVIKFYGGKTITKNNLKAGNSVIISETNNLAKLFYDTPGILYRFFSQKNIQYNLLMIVITLLIIYFGVSIGVRKFKWSTRSAFVIASINFFLFWVIYIASSESHVQFIKYFVPLIVLGMSLLFTNVGFYWSSRLSQKNTAVLVDDDLFGLLRNFSHGEWASRNLNSLILLLKNWQTENDETHKEQLEIRIKTYKEVTYPNLKRIIELAEITHTNSIGLNTFSRLVPAIYRELTEFAKNKSKKNAESLAQKFERLKTEIRDLKKVLYSKYSCDPYSIITEIAENYSDHLKQKEIKLSIEKKYTGKQGALIKSFELADIIDNLIQNTIRSIEDKVKNEISIIISTKTPKLIIETNNNGKVIPKKDYQKIFEDGYSTTGSTGSGLYLSRKILEKYGGKISLSHSNEKLGTSFKIELHEGIIK